MAKRRRSGGIHSQACVGLADTSPQHRSDCLLRLVSSKGVSESALRKVISAISTEQVSRRELQSAVQQRYGLVKHTMRLPGVDVDEVAIDMIEPKKLLTLVLSENDHMRRWFDEAWGAAPSSQARPWRLLIGWDEFVPGNKQAIQNSRKTMVLNFAFAELGHHLQFDTAWLTPMAIRASVVKQVRGGWSAILRSFLRLLLLGAEGMHVGGIPIIVRGRPQLLFAKVHTLLSDGDGIRQAMEWLGANGLKPCFRHWNVFGSGSDCAGRCAGRRHYVETSCTQPSSFRTWEATELRRAADVLILARQRHAAGEIAFARVDEIQKAYGYRCTVDGIIADDDLGRIIHWPTAFQYDWVHTMLSGGVLMNATWTLLARCDELRHPGQEALCDVLHGWVCPKQVRYTGRDVRQLWRFFDTRSRAENRRREGIRCSASELLTLARCIEEFVAAKVPEDERLSAEKAFFAAAVRTVDLLMMVKQGRVPCAAAADEVARSCQAQLANFIELNGAAAVTPKFHWAFDIAEQLRSTDFLMDAFVIERLHLRCKGVADNIKNTTSYEASVCAGIVNLQAAGEAGLDGMEGNTSSFPHPEFSHVRVGDRMRVQGERFAVGDWVQQGQQLGRVAACADDNGNLGLVVDVASSVVPCSERGRICTLTRAMRSLWAPSQSRPVIA